MFAVFPIMRQLHELLWYLDDVAARPQAAPIRAELDRAYAETEALTAASPEEILTRDVDAYRETILPILTRASELVRDGIATSTAATDIQPGVDLMGADLAGTDFRGANLRGTWLIGADLRSADLSLADVIGADFPRCGSSAERIWLRRSS